MCIRDSRDVDVGHAAAVGAGGAVDLFFHFLGEASQNAVGMVAGFEMAAKALVFDALLLAKGLDLDQVG